MFYFCNGAKIIDCTVSGKVPDILALLIKQKQCKKVKKIALSLVAVAACAGAFGAYENYQQSGESDALLAENVEAMSDSEWWNPMTWFGNGDRWNAKPSWKYEKVRHSITLSAGVAPGIKYLSKLINANGTITYIYEKEEKKTCNMCVKDPNGPYASRDEVPQAC